MANKTKIKKDSLGLYVIAGGSIARPFYGTMFKEGDEVKSHHFGGSSNAGVTILDNPDVYNFKRDGKYEIWSTTGTSSYKFKSLNFSEVKEKYDWYFENSLGGLGRIYSINNEEFKESFNK